MIETGITSLSQSFSLSGVEEAGVIVLFNVNDECMDYGGSGLEIFCLLGGRGLERVNQDCFICGSIFSSSVTIHQTFTM